MRALRISALKQELSVLVLLFPVFSLFWAREVVGPVVLLLFLTFFTATLRHLARKTAFLVVGVFFVGKNIYVTDSAAPIADVLIAIFLIFNPYFVYASQHVLQRVVHFILISGYAVMAAYYFFGIEVLLYQFLFGVDQTDLFKLGIFRNPGLFDEPSTLCYALLVLLVHCECGRIVRYMSYVLVVSTTSIGGIMAMLLLLPFIELRGRLSLYHIAFPATAALAIYLVGSGVVPLPDYIWFRIEAIAAGSDSSVGSRFDALPDDLSRIFFFGLTPTMLITLPDGVFLSGMGTLTSLFLHVGIFGPIIVVLVVFLNKRMVVSMLILLSISKFSILSPMIIFLLFYEDRKQAPRKPEESFLKLR